MKFQRTALTIVLCISMICSNTLAGNTTNEKKAFPEHETEAQKAQRLKWWTDSRFGMFIHWGLYALPARHEWVKRLEKIDNESYERYFQHFNPDLYNPKEWARMAKNAGMKYVVLTSKHHEGFCLWDSKYTDYKATNTPIGKDLIKEYVEAFRAEGLKVGFYYSLLDWHHPDYTIDRCHPMDTDDAKELEKLNKGRNMDNYRQYMKDQVRELLTNYGKIDIIWFDFSFPGEKGKGRKDWDSEGLIKLARSLQPDIIVDDRLDLKDVDGGWDFTTPEQVKVSKHPEYNGKKVYWETCQTFSGSWGYHRDETTWKSSAQLIELLIETVSKGGNVILNVGPTARGEFDYRAQDRLDAIGKWMHFNSRSIYNCTEAPEEFQAPQHTLLTYNPEKKLIYIHLLDYPLNEIILPFADKVDYAQFLHDGSELRQDGNALKLPTLKPNVEIPVIEVFLK